MARRLTMGIAFDSNYLETRPDKSQNLKTALINVLDVNVIDTV